jgi:hypothetical protein
MFETLGSQVPVMTVPGNHEYGSAEAFKSYNVRYPMPYLQSGSSDPNYWSRDIGPMHVVGLNSYASAKAGSYQYRWVWINTYENTIFSGLFTSINPSYFDVNKKGVLLVLTHCQVVASGFEKF